MAVWSLKKRTGRAGGGFAAGADATSTGLFLLSLRLPLHLPCFRESGKPCEKEFNSGYFFLWRFFLRRFLRLCVAILWPFLFFPLGIVAEGYKG